MFQLKNIIFYSLRLVLLKNIIHFEEKTDILFKKQSLSIQMEFSTRRKHFEIKIIAPLERAGKNLSIFVLSSFFRDLVHDYQRIEQSVHLNVPYARARGARADPRSCLFHFVTFKPFISPTSPRQVFEAVMWDLTYFTFTLWFYLNNWKTLTLLKMIYMRRFVSTAPARRASVETCCF